MLTQPQSGTLTAHPVMAVDDEMLIQIKESLWSELTKLGQGHQFRHAQMAGVPFILFATVNDARLVTGLTKKVANIIDTDFQGHLDHKNIMDAQSPESPW